MGAKGKQMPVKRTMNLYVRENRAAKPATFVLYALFTAIVLLGLMKVLVYDLWSKVSDAREELAVVQDSLDGVMTGISNYAEVKKDYQRYSTTDEERAQIDRMEIVALVDREVGSVGRVHSYSVKGMEIQISLDEVTLAQMADIVKQLEASPLVLNTTVNTAATTTEATEGAAAGNQVSASIRVELTKGVEEDETTIVIP